VSTQLILISEIIIGPRFRKKYRNIERLAESMKAFGLLQAIGITPNKELVFGARRILAAQLLGWTHIEAKFVHLEHIVLGERAENEDREDFLPSEKVAIARVAEEIARKEAKARQGTRTDLGQNLHDVGKTRDKIAKGLDTSGYTLEKMKYVVEAAEKNPDRFARYVEEMDETGKVNSVYAKVKGQIENDELAKQPIVIPPGKFPTIVCDPPWPIEKIRMEVNDDEPDFDYPRWQEEELEEKLKDLMRFIDSKATDKAILFMWSTIKWRRLVEDILERFDWSCLQGIWRKTRGMQPVGLPKFNYEPVFIARRGGAEFLDTKDFPLCFDGESREHSRKPVEFYNRVIRVAPGPRMNMFSREEIEGFERHGNEVDKFDEANQEDKDIAEFIDRWEAQKKLRAAE
jgi:N6-adenosine-specific RNA methylase IME4